MYHVILPLDSVHSHVLVIWCWQIYRSAQQPKTCALLIVSWSKNKPYESEKKLKDLGYLFYPYTQVYKNRYFDSADILEAEKIICFYIQNILYILYMKNSFLIWYTVYLILEMYWFKL